MCTLLLQVTSFVRAACKAVIPSEFWGCHDNEKMFYQRIQDELNSVI